MRDVIVNFLINNFYEELKSDIVSTCTFMVGLCK